MRKEKKYAGVVIPMSTPFTEDGQVDIASAFRIFDHICEAETFPFLLGTTGEAVSVPIEMRIDFIKSIMNHLSHKTQVYVGISDNCFKTSLFLSKSFSDFGADVAVAHLPSYYPLNTDQMLRYFETLAEKSALPIMIYNILSTTHMSIPLDVIETLSHHSNIVGMKDSERDLNRMKQSADMFSDRTDFSIMCGWTTESYTTLAMGFDGIVPNPGNAVPGLFKKLYDAVINEDKSETEKLQSRANEIAAIFQKDKILSEVMAGLKVVMKALGFCEPWVLPPMTRLSSEEEEKIRTRMRQMDLIK